MKYRKDIDGLRAVAVLAVVLFHAKVPGFSGGFVGVDVFFVISGFLITRMIADDVKAGCFSFAVFYHRRIRRIVPALLLIYFVGTIFASLLMLPSDMAEFGRTLMSSALFVSNVFFYNHAGYFDGPSELKPLLHTWSLSIEEQFYLVWPVLFLLVVRWRPERLPALVAIAGTASIFAFIGMARLQTEAAFFLAPFRAWELMLGASLALLRERPSLNGLKSEIGAAAALILIVITVMAVDAHHRLAVLAAIPACLGAALLIYCGIGRQPSANRLLSTKPAVAIGLVSYSLYLWHWPILSFARYHVDRALHWDEVVYLLAASLGAAILTYWFVEQPARRMDLSRMKHVLGGGLLSLGAVALVGHQMDKAGGWTFNFDPEIRQLDAAARSENVNRSKCNGAKNAFRNEDVCTFGRPRANGSYDMAILGDSHANHFAPTMSLLAEAAGLSGRQITVGGCLALLGYHEIISPFATEARCRSLRDAMVRFVEENPRLQLVVLAHRWSIYTGAPSSLDESQPPFYLLGSKGDARSPQRSREIMRQSLAQTLDFFERKGIRVLLLGEVPPLGIEPTRCIAKAIKNKQSSDRCGRPVEEVHRVLDDTNSLLSDQTSRRKGVSFFSPIDTMCGKNWCSAIVDGVYMYRDNNHLNRLGAEHLSRALHLPGTPAVR